MRRGRVCAIATAALVLALSATAQAQITIGQLAPPNPPSVCGGTSADIVQATTAGANPYLVPGPGVITSWSTNAGPGVGQKFMLKVFRPVGTAYLVLAHDGPRPLQASALNSFPVSIPVQAGDTIGVNDQTGGGASNACLFETGSPADVFAAASSDAADGSTVILPPVTSKYRLNLAATLKLVPTIALLAPAAGSVKGGTVVKIVGAEFGATSAVSFGGTPAAGFTVDSETQITAIAPASASLAKVNLTVTTIAGTATSAQQFVYRGCKVPKLAGGKLKASKKRIRKGGCKVGKVRIEGDVTGKTGEVVKQSPKPGKLLAPGAKVNVKLG